MAMMSVGKKRPSFLDKLSMPGEKHPEMDFPEEGSPEEEDSESPEEESKEDSEMPDGSPDLAKVSDDDLMAEIKKRGLTAELEKGGEEGDESGKSDHMPPGEADY